MNVITNSGISVLIENGIQIIKFNNPKKKNAISVCAYKVIKKALDDSARNEDVVFTVLTGEGDFYSSGFDITDPELQDNIDEAPILLKAMLTSFIDYPKLIIAVINGPAVGLAVTTLALCDIIYASEKATFQTPFSKLGLCAEGCASYTFPLIFGKSKANEMLYVGHKMSAKEAYQFGFVSEIYADCELHKIWEKIRGFKDISTNSALISKKMVTDFHRAKLHEANNIEIENLKICFQSEDFGNAIVAFLSRKSKL